MAAVVIGVDPHKGSHTGVVISAAEQPLGEIRVRASKTQADELVAWAAAWPERTWAVEGAGGVGRLVGQQLVAGRERVLDVQPKLASRVRLLQAGDTNKNDPNDALSVAVAALRSTASREVIADDYPAVLKVWSRRHRDLARLRNQVACRLHAVLSDLIPGGHSKEISAAQAAKILEQVTPTWPPPPRYGKSTPTAARIPTRSWPGENRTRKRSGAPSARSATPSSPASRPTPARQPPALRAREGNRGTALHPARPAHTPHAGSSDKPLPDQAPRYGPPPPQAHPRSRSRRKPTQPLDTNSKED